VDFTYTDEQQAIAELADRILGEQCPPETLRTLERSDEHFAADAWAALARADLLGLALPSAHGGSDLGVADAALVAQKVGRHVALVPYWPSTAAAMTVARWGSDAQKERWLPGAAAGTDPLAVALWQPAELGSPERPAVVATAQADGGWQLDGTKGPVPWAAHATAVLVPVWLADGEPGTDSGTGRDGRLAVFVVDTSTPGLGRTDEIVVDGEPMQTLTFDAVAVGPDRLLGDPADLAQGAEVAAWLDQRARALIVATALGVAEGALALTAGHVKQREQFGTPIGTFQAVGHRCADAYIDTEAIRLTGLQAVWQLDAGLDAGDALSIAAFWVAEGGQRVVHAAQHLHGGIGMDTDYPVHRYFRWAKVLEALGGGTHNALARLGASLAAGDAIDI
jgi:3-oxocholest-4-en-26-oyl-CoA dehydrogenase beta subunit